MASPTAQILIDDALAQLGVQQAGATVSGNNAALAFRIVNREVGRLSDKYGLTQYSSITASQALSDTQEAMVFWAAVAALAPGYGLDPEDLGYARKARNAEQYALVAISEAPNVSSDGLGGPPYDRFNLLRRTTQ